MSIRLMTLAWETHLPDSEKLVLLALADWANDEGVCWPSVKTLTKKCSKSERTVQNAVRMLKAKGHLDHKLTERGWVFNVHPIVGPDPATIAPPAESAPPQSLHQPPAEFAPNTSGIHSVPIGTGASADPVKDVFDLGVAILTAAGVNQRQARSLVGKWRKEHGETKVLAALLDCRFKAISEPVEWLTKSLTGTKYVSASGYEYRGDEQAVMRQAEKRADWNTYYAAKANLERAAA